MDQLHFILKQALGRAKHNLALPIENPRKSEKEISETIFKT